MSFCTLRCVGSPPFHVGAHVVPPSDMKPGSMGCTCRSHNSPSVRVRVVPTMGCSKRWGGGGMPLTLFFSNLF